MDREVGLGSHSLSHFHPSLIIHTVSVDGKAPGKKKTKRDDRAQKLCEQGGGPWLSFPIPFSPVPNKPYGFCGRKAP